MGFGEVLDLAFQVYRREFLDYTLIAAAGQAPAHALVAMSLLTVDWTAAPLGAPQLSAAFLGTSAAALVFSTAAWAAVASAIAGRALALDHDGRSDQAPAFGASYRKAVRRLPVLLVAGAAAALLLAFVVFGPILVVGVAGVLIGSVVFAGVLMILFGTAGFAWWASSVFGVLPAVVVEGCGPLRAIRRSFALAGGARFRILGTLAVVGVLVVLPDMALQSFAYGMSSVFSADPTGIVSSAKYWAVSTGSFVLSSVTTPLMASCLLVVYYDRKVRREGYDLEAAAASLAGAR